MASVAGGLAWGNIDWGSWCFIINPSVSTTLQKLQISSGGTTRTQGFRFNDPFIREGVNFKSIIKVRWMLVDTSVQFATVISSELFLISSLVNLRLWDKVIFFPDCTFLKIMIVNHWYLKGGQFFFLIKRHIGLCNQDKWPFLCSVSYIVKHMWWYN